MVAELSYLEAREAAAATHAEVGEQLPASVSFLNSGVQLVRRGDEWWALARVQWPLGAVRRPDHSDPLEDS